MTVTLAATINLAAVMSNVWKWPFIMEAVLGTQSGTIGAAIP